MSAEIRLCQSRQRAKVFQRPVDGPFQRSCCWPMAALVSREILSCGWG
jgi:hypothetical protein